MHVLVSVFSCYKDEKQATCCNNTSCLNENVIRRVKRALETRLENPRDAYNLTGFILIESEPLGSFLTETFHILLELILINSPIQ